MGGGTNRKTNDNVRINRSKAANVGGSGAGGGGGRAVREEDINQVCPPTFRVRVKPGKKIPEGSLVAVRHGRMFVGAEDIGALSEKDARTLEECLKEGIEYRGRIIINNNNYSVRFEQPE